MTHRSGERGLRALILTLFFLSGACGLVYEVVWMRMLTLVFGATALATSTILASFFAGLALGSVYFGRRIDRGAHPLRVYAMLEAGVGVFAFLMPVLFVVLTWVYVGIARHFDTGIQALNVIRFVLAFLVLVVPATFMGGTLPVMTKFFARRHHRLVRDIGNLYAINTFGAVVGALSAGFFLILFLGVKESAYAAGVVNLAIAGVILLLSRRLPYAAEEPEAYALEAAAGASAGPAPVALPPVAARLAFWAAAISGFCALALEVFWTRSLVFFLDNSTHAFTTILTAFLLGIAIGSFIVARFMDRQRRLLAWLGFLQVFIGLSALAAIPILNRLAPVFESMAGSTLNAWLPWKWVGMRFAKGMAVMLVPTVLMGMAFPLVTRVYTRSVAAVGTALGNIYSVNTVGGVLGSMLAGFVLIPLMGVQNGIILVAALSVAVGTVLLYKEPLLERGVRMAAVAGVAVVALGVGTYYVVRGPTILTSYYESVEQARVLSYAEGVGATVKVYVDDLGDRVLSVNGFPVAGTSMATQDAQVPLAHLPMLLTRVPEPRVNIVGFGSGGTSWEVTQYDVRRVDTVELVPAVIRAASWFEEVNHNVLADPDFNLILGDGRNHALVSDQQYDVISIDATSPKMAGNGSLYSLEFYRLLRDRLSDEGLVVQWLPFHLLSDAEVRMIAKTFQTVFPHTTVWFTPFRQFIILLGGEQPLRIDWGTLVDRFQRDHVRPQLAPFNVSDPIDFLSWFVMGEDGLAAYVDGASLNTDDHPYLEFTPAMAYFVSGRYRVQTMLDMRDGRESVIPLLTNLGDAEQATAVEERLRKRFEATRHSITGDIYLFLGEQERAMLEYRTALLVDPTEKNWANTPMPFDSLQNRVR